MVTLSLPLVAFVSLILAAVYVLLLIIRQMMPEKTHRYEGSYDADGYYTAHGTLHALNGDTYTGDFLRGTFHGKGTYVFQRGGGRYEGEFQEGVFHGQGVETYPDASVYTGHFSKGKRHGSGKMTYPSGAYYDGEWKQGRKCGRGMFVYADGSRFQGLFVDGKRDGTGWMYDKKGRKRQGRWEMGKLVGKLVKMDVKRLLPSTSTPSPSSSYSPLPSPQELSNKHLNHTKLSTLLDDEEYMRERKRQSDSESATRSAENSDSGMDTRSSRHKYDTLRDKLSSTVVSSSSTDRSLFYPDSESEKQQSSVSDREDVSDGTADARNGVKSESDTERVQKTVSLAASPERVKTERGRETANGDGPHSENGITVKKETVNGVTDKENIDTHSTDIPSKKKLNGTSPTKRRKHANHD